MAGERPVRADARVNRERILEAAQALYAEEGLDVSFNAVAQRAGIGNATLYRHFGSPEELLDAVHRARIRETSDLLAELAALEDPSVELRRFLSWVFETADLSLIGLSPDRRTLSTEAAAGAAQVRDRLDDLVERAHRAGVLQPDLAGGDILVAAAALVHVRRHTEIPAARAQAFLETVLRGLGVGD